MIKILMVAQREILENIKTKGFWIGIFVFPLVLTLFIVIPPLLEKTKDARKYAVIDESGWLLPIVDQHIIAEDLTRVFNEVVNKARAKGADHADIPDVFRQLAPKLAELDEKLISYAAAFLVTGKETEETGEGNKNSLPEYIRQTLKEKRESILSWWDNISPTDARNISPGLSKARYHRVKIAESKKNQKALNRMLSDETLFAYFVIGPDPIKGDEGSRYVSKNVADDSLRSWFRNEVSMKVRRLRLNKENIKPEVARWLIKSFRFEARKIGAEGAEEKVKLTDKILQLAPLAFVYLLFISILTVSQMLLTNTIEEKSNRIIEVLLSSVSPVQLMAGKIMGIAGTGLAIVLAWMATLFFGTKYLPGLLGAQPGVDLSVIGANPIYILSFVIYFFLGYLFYAAILVAIGSVCNTLKEAQNLMTPVMITMMVPLLAMLPIAKDPSGTLAHVLSYVPPFTPFVMMNRAASMPTFVEYAVTTILMLVSILGALWMAAKVFRIGVLLTGKPPKFREILKWLKAPIGAFPKS